MDALIVSKIDYLLGFFIGKIKLRFDILIIWQTVPVCLHVFYRGLLASELVRKSGSGIVLGVQSC